MLKKRNKKSKGTKQAPLFDKEILETKESCFDGKLVLHKGQIGTLRELTEGLVKFWVSRSVNRTRARETPKRVSMVRARLKEGYTPDELYQAIAGYCYSPWHRENNYDSLDIVLRSGEKVEQGCVYWDAYAPIEQVISLYEKTGELIESRREEIETYLRDREQENYFTKRRKEVIAEREKEQRERERVAKEEADLQAFLEEIEVEEDGEEQNG